MTICEMIKPYHNQKVISSNYTQHTKNKSCFRNLSWLFEKVSIVCVWFTARSRTWPLGNVSELSPQINNHFVTSLDFPMPPDFTCLPIPNPYLTIQNRLYLSMTELRLELTKVKVLHRPMFWLQGFGKAPCNQSPTKHWPNALLRHQCGIHRKKSFLSARMLWWPPFALWGI